MRSLWFGVLACAAMLVACSDDDSDFATRPSGGSSSSVCEGCDDGSSSSAKSSSSSAKSSSSATLANPCKTDSTDTCEYGELIDDRDGQTYKTVKIGDQVWMAENLNYAYLQPTEELDSSSFCYNDSAEYCEKYGRLYTWVAAEMACPEGWHLPTETEWKNLFTAVGGSSTAGSKLKSAFGWNDYKDKSGNGTDAFGFSALPAGSAECVISVRDGYDDEFVCGAYGHEGYSAFFWIFTEENSYSMGLFMQLSYLDDDAGLYYRSKKDYNYRYSVRCLQD